MEKTIEIALCLLKCGDSVEKVAQITGLSIEEIEGLIELLIEI